MRDKIMETFYEGRVAMRPIELEMHMQEYQNDLKKAKKTKESMYDWSKISLNFHKLTVLKTFLWVGFIGTLELVLLCESREVESLERRLFIITEVGVNYSISCNDLYFSSIWRDVTASTYDF